MAKFATVKPMNRDQDKTDDALGLLTQVRAVTFDVGGTLIKPSPSVGHIYAEVAARHGRKKVSPETLNRRFAAAWKGLKSFNHTPRGMGGAGG